jgi:type IV secretion system protein VirB1
LALALAASLGSRAADGQTLGISAFERLAQRCAPSVAPSTLAAIARTESGFDPLSLHDNTLGVSAAPSTVAEATSIAKRWMAAGHSIDLGLMQINSANLDTLGLTPEAAFDACRSLGAGAMILADDYAGGVTHASQQAALRVAFSRYNTGDPLRGFTNGYVGRVEAAARQVVPGIDPNADVSPSAVAAAAGERSEEPPVISPGFPWLVWSNGRSDESLTAEETNQQSMILSDAGHGASAAVVAYPASP